ncbi:TonB-dependent receptor [Piscinibacter sakaiensis]|nr:TonB-dependent receptor [Piscinibacter sakaiensis]
MSRVPLLAACLAAGPALLSPPTAAAQTPPAPAAPTPSPAARSADPAASAPPAAAGDAPVRTLGVVVVEGRRVPSSLPTQIPTTMESATRAEIDRSVNASDAEDALKYFPSLLVRKRYIGDYNHAILSSRASGTGNSARSAVYADGILLSNYLGNGVGGLSFPPRWGMVTPEEIERVDVMYGPFSAAYPGNSVGAVVDYVTRMPTRFEAHARVGLVVQPFELYGTKETYRAWQASAALGDRAGALSWWLNLSRSDSEGQPLTFATRLRSNGVAGSAGTPVTGAALDANNAGQPWFVVGAGTQYHTVQDHLKLKLALDLTPTLRASYLFGLWQNHADNTPASYLRDPSGQAVGSGPINIGGLAYTGGQALGGADFTVQREELRHAMHGLALKSSTRGPWDWEVSASAYDYGRDDKRASGATNTLPGALAGGPGTLADGAGTGWVSLAAKGVWRPDPARGAHVVEFGLQQDAYRLRYRTSTIAGNFLADPAGALANRVQGDTRLRSLWAQDAWAFAADWKAVLGLRAEQWEARDGRTDFSASSAIDHPARREDALSPKLALSWQWRPQTVLKASLGRAVRMPTVQELYGATTTTNAQFVNDPGLKPEQSWTGELSAEQDLGVGRLRVTGFAERTADAIYSQTLFDSAANRNVSRVQNVDRIRTTGLEVAANTQDWPWRGLDLQGSVTYADSIITRNTGFVTVPGDTVGKWQPNIPRWRATLVAGWRVDERWSATVGARYSGRQYRTLNNADVNGFTYQGVSRFFVVDTRVVFRLDRRWSVAGGIDNLNNDRYWNFHPYPQRSYALELRADL